MTFNIGAIIISKKILFDNEFPNWMYREEPIDLGDSGWRIFSSTEDEEYLNNSENFATISVEQLLEIDEDIAVILYAPINSSFERDTNNSWVPVSLG